MKQFFLIMMVTGVTFNLNTAFQSTAIPGPKDSFNSYQFNVIESFPSLYPKSNYFTNRNKANLLLSYANRPNSTPLNFQTLFGGYDGFSGSTSIIQLKNFVRKINGSENNLKHPEYCSSGTPLARHSPALYADGRSLPMDSKRNPRATSNSLGIVTFPLDLNKNNVTLAFTIWGQLTDHDIGLTQVNEDQSMPIQIPTCDPFMDAACTGTKKIPFKRSKYEETKKVRIQLNNITGWLDASTVYGSNEVVAKRLREFSLGKLKEGESRVLPLLKDDPHGSLDAGDMRANQNLLLASYHTIFVREHNRLCRTIVAKNPGLSEESIYQAAKNYVTGLIQKITYNDFLPILLGPDAYAKYIGEYKGYDENFTTVAFRFGHGTLVPSLPVIDLNNQTVGEVHLNSMFFRPDLLNSAVIDGLFRGLSKTIIKERNGELIDEIRNLLITAPQKRNISMDLYSLNIQRGRDHGLERFNFMRVSYGLPPLRSFIELTGNKERAAKLEAYYKDINEVDPWVGVLNEKSLPGAVIGQLGAVIIGQTFEKLRRGDRFFYENIFPDSVIAQIKSTTFSDIIMRNTEVTGLQSDIFHIKK